MTLRVRCRSATIATCWACLAACSLLTGLRFASADWGTTTAPRESAAANPATATSSSTRDFLTCTLPPRCFLRDDRPRADPRTGPYRRWLLLQAVGRVPAELEGSATRTKNSPAQRRFFVFPEVGCACGKPVTKSSPGR